MANADIKAIAFHEAGHAIVAREMGSRVRFVRIGADPLAHCSHRAPVAHAVTSLAGALAERRVNAHGPWGESVDEEMALKAAACFAPDEPDKALIGCRAVAAALIEANWPRVEAVAAALIARGRLTGDEIAELIEPLELAAAKKRQEATLKKGAVRGSSPNGSAGRALDKVGHAVGMDRKTLEKARS